MYSTLRLKVCVATGQLKGRGGPGRLGIRRGMRQRGGAGGRGVALTGRGAARGGAGGRGEKPIRNLPKQMKLLAY